MNALVPTPPTISDTQQRAVDAAYVLLQEFDDALTPDQHAMCAVTLAIEPEVIGTDYANDVMGIYLQVAGVRV